MSDDLKSLTSKNQNFEILCVKNDDIITAAEGISENATTGVGSSIRE
jgi:hypothetical protein